ncbi:trypsin-like serine protease [Leifsonia sp. NPDC102414]|uniref:trypsin-like serine protease n=1 Tax=Leifsonia sp. NPDC102414 TaxID=3364124 RepID=UPI0037FDB69B
MESQPKVPVVLVLLAALLLTSLPTQSATAATVPGDGANPNREIVGGTEVSEGHDRYMASIRDIEGKHVCGGTLVADDIVMTAAHCLGGTRIVPELASSVLVGSTDLRHPEHGQIDTVSEIVRHPLFDFPNAQNDLAFLILDHPINGIAPISLPEEDDSSPGSGTVEVALGGVKSRVTPPPGQHNTVHAFGRWDFRSPHSMSAQKWRTPTT